jgi:hypothetical protein
VTKPTPEPPDQPSKPVVYSYEQKVTELKESLDKQRSMGAAVTYYCSLVARQLFECEEAGQARKTIFELGEITHTFYEDEGDPHDEFATYRLAAYNAGITKLVAFKDIQPLCDRYIRRDYPPEDDTGHMFAMHFEEKRLEVKEAGYRAWHPLNKPLMSDGRTIPELREFEQEVHKRILQTQIELARCIMYIQAACLDYIGDLTGRLLKKPASLVLHEIEKNRPLFGHIITPDIAKDGELTFSTPLWMGTYYHLFLIDGKDLPEPLTLINQVLQDGTKSLVPKKEHRRISIIESLKDFKAQRGKDYPVSHGEVPLHI